MKNRKSTNIREQSVRNRNIMLSWIDYVVIFVPLIFVYFMAFYCRKYIRGVVDFLSTGRCNRLFENSIHKNLLRFIGEI